MGQRDIGPDPPVSKGGFAAPPVLACAAGGRCVADTFGAPIASRYRLEIRTGRTHVQQAGKRGKKRGNVRVAQCQ